MVAVCLMRSISEFVNTSSGKRIDLQWGLFWQMIEACIAVTVVSLTAFRSLYGVRISKQEEKRRQEPRLASYRRRLLSHRKKRADEFGEPMTDMEPLPRIPGATVTGMRTMVNGNYSMHTPSAKDGLYSMDKIQGEVDFGRVASDCDAKRSVESHV